MMQLVSVLASGFNAATGSHYVTVADGASGAILPMSSEVQTAPPLTKHEQRIKRHVGTT